MAGDRDFDALLESVLIGGREKRPVVIADYDPLWPERFSQHRVRITAVLDLPPSAVHHIGSTSVPGLAAKPIVDIIVEIPAPADEATYVPQLEEAGYELRVRELDHWMLRTPEQDVHIHVWLHAVEVRRHLLFRDWLRSSPEDRAAYEALKRGLAEEEWDDMNYYAAAKSELIAEIMDRAEAWATETGWVAKD